MKSETELWRAAHDEVRNGRRAVMCTVIQGKGSIPRELGARMLIGEVGTLAGTIGGGCGEADVLVAARKAIAGAEFPRFVEVDLAGSLEQDEVQACGGTMRVFVRLLDSSDEGWIAKLAHAEAEHEPMIVIEALDSSATQVVSESDNEHAMAGFLRDFPAQGAKLFRHQDEEYFAQRIGTSLRLVLVGSGHVAMPLCEFAAKSGFAVTVVDDRPSYVTQARFPDAEKHLVGNHASLLGELVLDERAFVVIVTRGHKHDMDSLRAALQQAPRYIGMIGSRRRALETLRALGEEGFDEARLAAVHSPIGLDIGALTPAEIAVAVLAEMIALRRGGSGRPLREIRPML